MICEKLLLRVTKLVENDRKWTKAKCLHGLLHTTSYGIDWLVYGQGTKVHLVFYLKFLVLFILFAPKSAALLRNRDF